ncbi:MAG: hypothetical protein ACSLFL_03135, partial [Alphaproteobacteria bacterium]
QCAVNENDALAIPMATSWPAQFTEPLSAPPAGACPSAPPRRPSATAHQSQAPADKEIAVRSSPGSGSKPTPFSVSMNGLAGSTAFSPKPSWENRKPKIKTTVLVKKNRPKLKQFFRMEFFYSVVRPQGDCHAYASSS